MLLTSIPVKKTPSKFMAPPLKILSPLRGRSQGSKVSHQTHESMPSANQVQQRSTPRKPSAVRRLGVTLYRRAAQPPAAAQSTEPYRSEGQPPGRPAWEGRRGTHVRSWAARVGRHGARPGRGRGTARTEETALPLLGPMRNSLAHEMGGGANPTPDPLFLMPADPNLIRPRIPVAEKCTGARGHQFPGALPTLHFRQTL